MKFITFGSRKLAKTLKLAIALVAQFWQGVELALFLALCTLGLGISASAQGPAITTFDAPGAGTAPGQGTFPGQLARRAPSRENTQTRAMCVTAFYALPTGA